MDRCRSLLSSKDQFWGSFYMCPWQEWAPAPHGGNQLSTLLFWCFCLPGLILPGRGDLLSKPLATSFRLCFQGNPTKIHIQQVRCRGGPLVHQDSQQLYGVHKAYIWEGAGSQPRLWLQGPNSSTPGGKARGESVSIASRHPLHPASTGAANSNS